MDQSRLFSARKKRRNEYRRSSGGDYERGLENSGRGVEAERLGEKHDQHRRADGGEKRQPPFGRPPQARPGNGRAKRRADHATKHHEQDRPNQVAITRRVPRAKGAASKPANYPQNNASNQ